ARDLPLHLPGRRSAGHPGLRLRAAPGPRRRSDRHARGAPHRRQHRGAEVPRPDGHDPQGDTMTEQAELIDRLNRASVSKHFDAYEDIDWDAPEHAIDPADPRWELAPDDPIGGSAWYRALPAATRARFGLHRAADAMKVGWQFE